MSTATCDLCKTHRHLFLMDDFFAWHDTQECRLLRRRGGARSGWIGVAVLSAPRVLSDEARRIVATARILTWSGVVA